jgi:diguanylate cyclase (GGDEF) domain
MSDQDPPARKPLNLKKPAEGGPLLKPARSGNPWRLLVVDDDPAVHDITRLIVANVQFRNRGVEMLSAFSAAEAAEVMRRTGDIAVVLLDVVMETDDAGLKLVRTIREEIGNTSARIILRTGQPGQAPEERVIVDYDINDYKAKSELTAQKLFSALITALRSYQDITSLEANRRGLTAIIESADTLFQMPSMRQFAAGALEQLSTFVGVNADGILCAEMGHFPESQPRDCNIHILACNGTFENCGGCTLGSGCLHEAAAEIVRQAFAKQHSVISDEYAALYIAGGVQTRASVALIHSGDFARNIDQQLLKIFMNKISIGFQNVTLHEHLEHLVIQRTTALEAANIELERLATTDSLTGILNRRAFLARAEAEFGRSRRHGHPLSVLAVDIDHFKAVNDRFGHAGGDEVLCAVVRAMQEDLRNGDMAARLGGEEFILLLPETSLAGAVEVAERVRCRVAGIPFDFDGTAHLVTISIGVVEALDGDGKLDSMLSRADDNLYRAKEEGRNRVISTP